MFLRVDNTLSSAPTLAINSGCPLIGKRYPNVRKLRKVLYSIFET